jgi:hypothetical protein
VFVDADAASGEPELVLQEAACLALAFDDRGAVAAAIPLAAVSPRAAPSAAVSFHPSELHPLRLRCPRGGGQMGGRPRHVVAGLRFGGVAAWRARSFVPAVSGAWFLGKEGWLGLRSRGGPVGGGSLGA